MYKDLLGKNREYVEAQLRNIIADEFKESIVYKIRKNLSIAFYFVENKVKQVNFIYSKEVSPKKIIEEIGYEFSECYKLTETDYRIKTCAGVKIINIYYNPREGTHASLSSLE